MAFELHHGWSLRASLEALYEHCTGIFATAAQQHTIANLAQISTDRRQYRVSSIINSRPASQDGWVFRQPLRQRYLFPG